LTGRLLRPYERVKKENPWTYIILLAPIVFALGINPNNLGEFAALKKGLVTSGVEISQKAKEELLNRLAQVREYQHLNLKELLSLGGLENFPEGLKVKTEGLLVEKRLNGGMAFYLVRFRIVCCAADALPLAIEVEKPAGETILPGQWVEIWGILNYGTSRQKLFIKAEKILPVPEPSNPYLY